LLEHGHIGAGREITFSSEDDAKSFFDEVRFMLATQMIAPNSPQWFNTGLNWAYGIDGPSQGHFYVDNDTWKTNSIKQFI
jgi:ribonucleoside-diphosphate reductase alpha chain